MKRTNGPDKLLEKRAGGEQVVERRAGGDKTDKCCLVCSSSMVTGSLGVCRPCQVLLHSNTGHKLVTRCADYLQKNVYIHIFMNIKKNVYEVKLN